MSYFHPNVFNELNYFIKVGKGESSEILLSFNDAEKYLILLDIHYFQFTELWNF